MTTESVKTLVTVVLVYVTAAICVYYVYKFWGL